MHTVRLVVLGSLLSAASVARAQPQAGATFEVVEYRAPGTCPEEAAFVAAILSRAPGARRVDAASATVRFSAEVRTEGPGSLSVSLEEGVSRREIASASCDEAVASMALIAAMVLEAPASSRAALAGIPPALEPAPAPPSDRPVLGPAPLSPAASPPALERDAVAATEPTRAAAPSSATAWSVSAAVGIETAVAPSPPPLLALGWELDWERSALWSPSVRVQAVASAEAVETTPRGDASFRLVTGRLDACPLRFGSASAGRVMPCATFDLGVLRGAGGDSVENARSASAPWLAAGLSLRSDLDLGSGLRLNASVAGRLLPRHDRFVFDKEDLIYDIPPLSLGFELGFAYWP